MWLHRSTSELRFVVPWPIAFNAAVDIPTMASMSIDDYKVYLRDGNGLVSVDHHDVLRSGIAEYPIAANKPSFGRSSRICAN
jgi:hypothetical protein